MKLILTILILISLKANAVIYYIDNAGSDIASGTSEGTAWQTVAKINSSTFVAGDFIKFKKGGIWNEKLNFPSSGSVGNVITITSYGSGAKPILTGFQSLSFADQGSNIWAATFTNSVPYQNTVYTNGAMRAKGRYPNTGWLTFTSHSTNVQLTGGLTGTPNYTGGEVVIRTNNFTIDKAYITSQSVGTINFSPSTYYNLIDNYGYFIQNIPSVLDTLNEWCIDTTTKVISVYATSLPTGKASSIDTLVNLIDKSYITFDGIAFEGANVAAIQLKNSNNITITNCDFDNLGADAIAGYLSNFITVSYCTFNHTYNDALAIIDLTTALPDSDDATVIYNSFRNTGYVAGMGKSRFHTYTAIQLFGDRADITNNTIDSTGYIGINFYGDSMLVKNNLVNTYCYVKDDGAAIYTWNGYLINDGYSIVRSNIVLNGQRAQAGTTGAIILTAGIYMDNGVINVLIDSNTTYNVPPGAGVTPILGIFIHDATYITVTNNTLINMGLSTSITPAVQSNIIFKKNKSYLSSNLYFSTTTVHQNVMSVMDSNYYSNPADANKIVNLYSLAGWQSFSGFDLNSGLTPTGVTAAIPILKYNATTATVNQSLSGTYKDMAGAIYVYEVSLRPFEGKLLFTSSTQTTIPRRAGGILFTN